MRGGFNFINAALAERIKIFSKTIRTFVFAKFDSNQVATELVTLPLWEVNQTHRHKVLDSGKKTFITVILWRSLEQRWYRS